jgi:hypothetical protein
LRALKAVSLAPAARRWLQSSPAARVLHVFESTCNLVNDKGEILSLVTAAAGNAPFAAIVVPAKGGRQLSFAVFVDAHSRVTLHDRQLSVGPLLLEWEDAAVWQPRPRWQRLRRRPPEWQRHLPLLLTLLCHWPAIADGTTPATIMPSCQDAWQGAAALLRQGVAAGDLEQCHAGAAGLAGLGDGLTPAGDDFLVGAMTALWLRFPPADAARLAGVMAQAAVPRTTLFSGAWLQAAARGEAAASWHLLVEAFITDEATAVRQAGQRILQTGHTSGAAALAGFLSMMPVCADLCLEAYLLKLLGKAN